MAELLRLSFNLPSRWICFPERRAYENGPSHSLSKIFTIHEFSVGHLAQFQDLTVINCPESSMGTHVSLYDSFNSSENIPRWGVPGSNGTPVFTFWDICILMIRVAVLNIPIKYWRVTLRILKYDRTQFLEDGLEMPIITTWAFICTLNTASRLSVFRYWVSHTHMWTETDVLKKGYCQNLKFILFIYIHTQ